MTTEVLTREEQRARGIAAMGRVERDFDGFTVYSTAPIVPDSFRVWDDPHAGVRCTCERFGEAFRAAKDEYKCEHILAVELTLVPPVEEICAVPNVGDRGTRVALLKVV